MHYHLGNHDPAGWRNGGIPEDHELFGLNMLVQKLNMPGEYFSFDHGHWLFAVLKNMQHTEPGKYRGEVREEQLDFLRNDLKENAQKPTVIFGHLPPITAIEFVNARAEKKEDEEQWTIGFNRTMKNPAVLIDAMHQGKCQSLFERRYSPPVPERSERSNLYLFRLV